MSSTGKTISTSPVAASTNRTIQKKVQQVLSTSLYVSSTEQNHDEVEDQQLLHSLQHLSSIYTSNTVQQRRQLRGILEKKTLETNQQFLQQLGVVYNSLQQLQTVCNQLEDSCSTIAHKIKEHESKTKPFLVQIESLDKQLKDTQKRERSLQEFMDKFQLAPHEKQTLLAHGNVDSQFFVVLNKVHDIYTQCKLVLRQQQQTASLEIMEEMSMYLDHAYERLSRWIQDQCKMLATAGSNEDEHVFMVEDELKQALSTISERPALLKVCVKEIIYARKNYILQKFLDALTKGNPSNRAQSGGKRLPIHMQAYDPLRYIGNILAWVHQSAASERELIDSLLSIQESNDNSKNRFDNITDKKIEISFQILNEVFDALCGQLKLRVEEILQADSKAQGNMSNDTEMVVFFRLAQLLELYSFTISKMLGAASALPKYLLELRNLSMAKFFEVMKSDIEELEKNVSKASVDTSVPATITEALEKLNDIMNTYSRSVVPEKSREEDFKNVLNAFVDPIISAIKTKVEEKLKKASTVLSNDEKTNESIADAFVFLINCLFIMQNSISKFAFTTQKTSYIVAEMDAQADAFVSLLSAIMHKAFGFDEKLNLIRTNSTKEAPLSTIEGMSTEAVKKFIHDFYTALSALGGKPSTNTPSSTLPATVLFYQQKQCYKLISTKFREYARNMTLKELASSYSVVYKAVHNPANGYTEPTEIAYHTPEQVQTLLDIH